MSGPSVNVIAASAARALAAAAQRRRMGPVLVFGSVARGQARPDSDVDLLVDPPPDVSAVEIAAFHDEAEAILGRRVDVVTRNTLEPGRHHKILAQARPLDDLPDADTGEEGMTDRERLQDVLSAIAKARLVLTGVTREAYLAQGEKQLAAERCLTILGEAVYKLSPRFKAEHPEIPADQITALRHFLIHGYAVAEPGRVWDLLHEHIDPLEVAVREVLEGPPPEPARRR